MKNSEKRKVTLQCEVSELDGSHTGEVVLYWGLDEEARHEHMSDEYKDLYIIQYCCNPHPGPTGQTQYHHIGSRRTELRG